MDDLISRKALLEDIKAAKENGGMGAVVADTLSRYVKRQPAVDARPVVGHKFSVGCTDGENIVGVAIVGRPVARYLDSAARSCQKRLYPSP